MDPSYEPNEMELRTLFGLKMEQRRNDAVIDAKLFENVTSKNKTVCFPALYKYDCRIIMGLENGGSGAVAPYPNRREQEYPFLQTTLLKKLDQGIL